MNVAFIGCGKIANFHADVLKALKVDISSVCGRKESENAKKFAEKYRIPKIYDTWKELIRKEKPDTYWVLTPWDITDKMLIPMIETGIPCLFEKPVALSSRKIQEAIKLRDKIGANVLVGFNRRFYDFIPELKKILKKVEIDAIEINLPEPRVRPKTLMEKKLSRYRMLYTSSHVIDLLYYLIGDMKVSYMKRKKDKKMGPLAFNGMLETMERVPIHFISNWGAPANFSLRFYCREQIIDLSPIERMRVFKGIKIEQPTKEIPIRRYIPKIINEVYTDAKYKPGFYKQAKNFLDTCVLEKNINTIGCSLEDALKVTNLCEKIKEGEKKNATYTTIV